MPGRRKEVDPELSGGEPAPASASPMPANGRGHLKCNDRSVDSVFLSILPILPFSPPLPGGAAEHAWVTQELIDRQLMKTASSLAEPARCGGNPGFG